MSGRTLAVRNKPSVVANGGTDEPFVVAVAVSVGIGIVFFAPEMGGYFLELANFEEANAPDEETNEFIHPVCFVQITDDSATYWASQEKYREEVGLEDKALRI